MRRRDDLSCPETLAWAREMYTDDGIEFLRRLYAGFKAQRLYDRTAWISFKDFAVATAATLLELGRTDLVLTPVRLTA